MRRYLLAGGVAIWAWASPAAADDASLPAPQVKLDGDQVTIIVPPLGKGAVSPSRLVPYTAEPWNLNAPVNTTEIREADIFGSGLAFDLDGDGHTTGVFPVGCEKGAATIAIGGQTIKLRPLGAGPVSYRSEGGQGPSYRLGEAGAYALLYRPCAEGSSTFVGLSARPIPVEHIPGPALQVIVFEALPGPEAKSAAQMADLTLDGKPLKGARVYRGRDWELLLEGQRAWTQMTWVVLTLPNLRGHELRFRLTGRTSRAGLIASSVNASPSPLVRVRGAFGVTRF